MSTTSDNTQQPPALAESPPLAPAGRWRPVLALLLLSPAIGELLSGSSPPLQFFNPVFLLLLVGLYGCGALLVRETVARRHLASAGLLLLGAAYGIIEEGLTCKSFFNPNWTDTGFLSVYGRAWGVNWVWAFGLTVYHATVSITAPIFLTEALFPRHAQAPWLRRRGCIIAAASLALVVILGFLGFDNRQFHLTEVKAPLALARRLDAPTDPLARFMAAQLTSKSRALVHTAATKQSASVELRHALQDELNRLLPRSDLYSSNRFASIPLPEQLRQQAARPLHGDKLVALNRTLLEHAFPVTLATRPVYPFRPSWWLTAGCALVVLGLILLALRQTRTPALARVARKPWLKGVGFTVTFALVGFVLPSLVEHGLRFPAALDCGLWCIVAAALAHLLNKIDAAPDRLWRRGLWALGVITPWVLFATLLGVFVRMIGAKSFSGMPIVALAFALAILTLGLKWNRRLERSERAASWTTAPNGAGKSARESSSTVDR